MAQQVQALAAPSVDLNLIFRTHVVEGGNESPQVVLQPPQVSQGTHMASPIDK